MERVTVAELKAKLSHYLREVREGKSFTVVNRDIPVAVLAPYEPEELDDLDVIEPTADPAAWGQIGADLLPLLPRDDVVALLREERDDRDLRLDLIVEAAVESRSDGEGRSPRDDER